MKVGEESDYGVSASLPEARVGSFVAVDGKYYLTKAEADKIGGAVAMVVFHDTEHPVDGTGYHGLGIALNDAPLTMSWGGEASNTPCTDNCNFGIGSPQGNTQGVMNTRLLAQAICNMEHTHFAARTAMNWESQNLSNFFSPWFLPSTGQWIRALWGMYVDFDNTKYSFVSKNGITNMQTISQYFSEDGCKPLAGTYWTSTEYDHGKAWYIVLSQDPFSLTAYYKNTQAKVRPFIAFDPVGLTKDNGVEKKDAKVGYVLAENGKFYASYSDVLLSGQKGVALVVVKTDKKNMVEQNNDTYTGLAVALNPSTEQYIWGPGTYSCYYRNKINGKDPDGCNIRFSSLNKWRNGLEITDSLGLNKCQYCGGSHPLFQAAMNYQSLLTEEVRNAKGFSHWFVPSTAQYISMLVHFGGSAIEYDGPYENYRSGNQLIAFEKVGQIRIEISEEDVRKMRTAFLMAGMPVKYNCWTANRFDDFYTYADFAWDFNLEFIPKDRILTNFYMHYKQNENNHLWPMIAF